MNEYQSEWTCECGTKNVTKFCGECGRPRPVQPVEWTCECGTKNTTKFCGECGRPRPTDNQPAAPFVSNRIKVDNSPAKKSLYEINNASMNNSPRRRASACSGSRPYYVNLGGQMRGFDSLEEVKEFIEQMTGQPVDIDWSVDGEYYLTSAYFGLEILSQTKQKDDK